MPGRKRGKVIWNGRRVRRKFGPGRSGISPQLIAGIVSAVGGAYGLGRAAHSTIKKAASGAASAASAWMRPKRRKYLKGGIFRTKRARKPYRRTKLPNFNMKGAVFKREDGGIVSDPDLTYIGHSNAPHKGVNFVVWMAVVRKLIEKAWIVVQTFEESVGELNIFNYTMEMYWYQETDSIATSSYTITFGPASGDPLVNNVARIAQHFYAVSLVGPDSVWKDMVLKDSTGETVARMTFSNLNVQLSLKSMLAIQNRTPATTGSGQDETNINDVAQNPLYGYLYAAKGTGFQPKHRFGGVGSYEGFMADQDSGIIKTEAAKSVIDIKKPPHPGFFMRCSRNRRDILQPGLIKRDYIRDSLKMSWNSYWRRMNLGAGGNTTSGTVRRTFLGTAHMYAHEKLLNSRVEEPSIALGYEISLELGAMVFEKKGTFCPALVEVVPPPPPPSS